MMVDNPRPNGVIKRRKIGVKALVVLLIISGCAQNIEPSPTTTPATSTTGPPTETAPPTTRSTLSTTTTVAQTSTTAPVQGWEVTVEDGQVVGGPLEIRVDLGSEVEIVVLSDSADEVHVHGYDLLFDVTPDMPLTITFDADVPGIFEIEMEDARLLIVELEVS